MMMISFRLQKRKILAIALAVGVIALGGGYLKGRWAARTATPTEGMITLKGKNPTVKTPEQRLEFISSYGWEVDPEPVEMMEVIIPAQFDEVYEKYNYLQKQQGYNLEKVQAKRCKRYSYTVRNYPGGIENVRINLLVYKNKVVGGDVSSTELGGFMHGFDIATSATWLSVPDSAAPVSGGTSTPQTQAPQDPSANPTTLQPADPLEKDIAPAPLDPSEEAAEYRE